MAIKEQMAMVMETKLAMLKVLLASAAKVMVVVVVMVIVTMITMLSTSMVLPIIESAIPKYKRYPLHQWIRKAAGCKGHTSMLLRVTQ